MTIPTVENLLLPLLQHAADQNEHTFKGAVDHLAKRSALTTKELNELQPSGRQTKFEKKVGWAKQYLQQANLLESTGRGLFVITKQGQVFLAKHPKQLGFADLRKLVEFTK